MADTQHFKCEPDIVDLFRSVTAGEKKFTRRMAIAMADTLGFGPMTLISYLEKGGLLLPGSFEWFKQNGGITRAQVEQVRQETRAMCAAQTEARDGG